MAWLSSKAARWTNGSGKPPAGTDLHPPGTPSRSRGSVPLVRPRERSSQPCEAGRSTPNGGVSQLPRRGDAWRPLRQSDGGVINTGSGPDAAGAARRDFPPKRGWRRPRFIWSRALVADDLDDPAALAGAVELHEEDALPGPEAELAVTDRNRLARRPEQHRHAVRVAIRELDVLRADVLGSPVPVVMRVVLLARDDPPQHADEVLEEARLEFVNPHAAGRVGGVDAGDAVLHAALGDAFLHFVCDVPDLEARLCPQALFPLKDLHLELPPPSVGFRDDGILCQGRVCPKQSGAVEAVRSAGQGP